MIGIEKGSRKFGLLTVFRAHEVNINSNPSLLHHKFAPRICQSALDDLFRAHLRCPSLQRAATLRHDVIPRLAQSSGTLIYQ